MAKSKKIISLLLSVIMIMSVFTIVPFTANAAEAEAAATAKTDGDYEYYVLDDDTAGITRYTGEGGDITIPSTLGGYTVTSIDVIAFEGCMGLTSVTIPDTVTSIGDYAFRECTGLTRVDIPDSVTIIGGLAFYKCTGLTRVTIGKSVTSIGEWAFSFCTGLKSIDIPDSVTSIGSNAFAWCTGLTSVTIPDSVTSIGSSAFYETAWYNNQPNGLVYAGKVAYKMKGNCPSEVVIKDGTLGIADSAFSDCTGLTSIDIPDSVTSIGDYAFRECTGLTSIDIPDSVTSIGDGAFRGCTGLTSIKVAEGNTVYDSRDNCNAIIETESNVLICGCKNTIIPDSVTSIGIGAFDGCTSLTSIDIPDSVTSIGHGAFEYCTGLTSINIPDSVTSIGIYAFDGCTGLTSVTIGDSVTSIGVKAFSKCTSLTSVTIGKSVSSIGSGAFSGCENLTEVHIKDIGTWLNLDFTDNKSKKSNLFENTYKLYLNDELVTDLEIPADITNIKENAMYGCESLKRVTIPATVTKIGRMAFEDCTNLEEVIIADGVTDIGGAAFYGCQNLKNVTIPNSVTGIGNYAFGNKIDGFTIYGYEGSEAEKYAKDNEFTFVPLKSKTDEATGIILDIPEDTELTIKDITSDIISTMPAENSKMTAYDISLTKDSETVQPENVVTVKIPCTNENAKVYRREGDSTMTDMNAKYKDGYMVFTTDHFSVYVLAEPEPEVVTVIGDVTGDGKTNVQDCTAILRYVRKLDTLSEDQLKRADVTGDGKVNVQDVTRILRHVRKIETLY